MMKAAGSRAGVHIPVNRSFERELAMLEAMAGQPLDSEGIERVRKALTHENNYLVAKAARLVADNALLALMPEVRAAYDRFFDRPVTTDPQCWAKNALVKALVTLECRDAAVYMRGLRHTQEEPVWGGNSDTAGTLRGICTHALVLCDGLGENQLLDILLTPLLDHDKTVRMEAARAIGQVGSETAALLLKLRVMLRKDDSEVMGACFSSLLGMERIDRKATIALVADFLDDGEEAAAEAAFSLAETHDHAALDALIARRRIGTDAWFGSVLDNAIALTRLPESMEFLLQVIAEDPRQAASALEAISRVYQSPDVRLRVLRAVEKAESERAQQAFQKFFPEDRIHSTPE